ncbi:hypothetical protein LTR56_016224 [Elasticomyces elasticus]|nr:hypothetical protein LTR56_016224 [Elasticomyces elasticus]KAK3636065.1 hypothetical protein LTR22_018912 [Elasticomyces elasticus]KAK4912321.1 hypothetical protein LTR49_019229 [Elasticomyces elasticus]KAK5751394.1 hypothetical protein LTS12_018552 [Elasticomyces elasticus]
MSASSSTAFSNLPARPPTPPRDTNAPHHATACLDDGNETGKVQRTKASAKSAAPISSPHSPPTSQESASGSGTAKRVDFTPNPTYHQIARTGQLSSPSAQLRKRRPTARDAKPLRSILKQATHPPPLTPDDLDSKLSYFSPHEPGSFARMLQSAISQLAGASVPARLDAYLALNGALRAYENVPDADTMVAKMSLLMQFLTRDMAWKNTAGTLDTNIVTQSIKLTSTIMYDRRLAAALDDDFRSFVIDRSITVVEHADMPKAIVKNHMMLLAQQRFSSKAMTAAQADRTINTITSVEERCSGNTVIGIRLVIYQRLLEQAPVIMLQRMRDWFEHVVHGMLSSIKDIRVRAIEICNAAGLTLGTQPLATKTVLDLFDSQVEGEQTFGTYIELRLGQMIKEKDLEVGAYVPQIWSAIVLLFRNKRHLLEKWSGFKAWLKLLQQCLNVSDLAIKHQAYLAWNKLVFTVMPDSSTSRSMMRMLMVPPHTGLNTRKADKNAKAIHMIAQNTYHHLLHYSLRPGLSHEELDVAWDDFVEPTLSHMIEANAYGRQVVCEIVHGLCSSRSGTWNVNVANEAAEIQPSDLPRLDPKWVRSRFAKVLKLVQAVFTTVASTSESGSAALNRVWYAFVQSVADAGTQEIKTSNDLKQAVAHIVGLCRTVWQGSSAPAGDMTMELFVQRYVSLLSVAVGCIGTGAFSEEFLIKTNEDAIQVASTPSHRQSKHHIIPQSPLVYLFGLLYQPPSWLQQTQLLAIPASALLKLLTSSRPSANARTEMIAKSSQTWSTGYAVNATQSHAAGLWQCLAEETRAILQSPDATLSDSAQSQSLGLELRHASAILAQGLPYVQGNSDVLQAYLDLYDAMFSVARKGAGVAGTVVAVVEPSAKSVLENATSASPAARLSVARHLISTALWPRSKQELDQARKALWGIGLAPHNAAIFDPYDHLYKLLSEELTRMYEELHDITDLSETAVYFLARCPPSLLPVAMRKTQAGFACWIADSERKTATDTSMLIMITSMWTGMVLLLDTLPQRDSALLKALEPLLIAGFTSPHKSIVNQTVIFWNASFGAQDALEYPRQLAKVLQARAIETEMTLPGFSLADSLAEEFVLPAFFESQSQAAVNQRKLQASSAAADHEVGRVPATIQPLLSAHFAAQQSPQVPRTLAGTGVKSLRSKRPGPKSRLRHNDSQIDFAPIESSPGLPIGESQLTERQREVKAKQQSNAHVFPNLSSSPAIRSSAPYAGIPKRLDFAANKNDEYAGTPKRSPDARAHMSDDVTSSPTPSSNRDGESARLAVDEDEMTEDDNAQDPPSSPPRQEEDALPHVDADLIHDGDAIDETIDEVEKHGMSAAPSPLVSKSPAPTARDSDLPSDTLLPAEQLQLEAEQAANRSSLDDMTEGTTFFSSPMRQAPNSADENAAPGDAVDQVEVVSVESPEISRIEESFIALPPPTEGEVDSPESQQSQRSTRKRKRSANESRASKKRKSHSPLKAITGFFSSFVGGSHKQQDEDDDMEEDIVVVHSVHSPPKSESARKAPSPVVVIPVARVEPAEPSPPEKDTPPSESRSQTRRRRRQSNKSTTDALVASPSLSSQPPSLKRKASQRDESSALEEPATSFVKDTPAPPKKRKQREGPDLQLVNEVRSSQEAIDLRRSTRRSRATSSQPDEVEKEDDGQDAQHAMDDQLATPQKQSDQVAIAPEVDRNPPSPRTILGRLKDVLADLPRMLLGSQEEREMDDVLFEIRREVHEASRRGRQ